MKIIKKILNIKNINHYICLLFILFCVLPMIVFGENSVITIHDNLDWNTPFMKYAIENGYYFKLFDKTATLDNINISFMLFDFSFYNLIYYLLPDYIAYVFTYIFGVVAGYFSLYYALCLYKNKIQCDKKSSNFLISLISVCFAFLPIEPIYKIAVSVLPLYFIAVYKITVENNKHWLFAFLFLPFFSYFSGTLLYVIGLYFIFIIVISIYKKKLNLTNLLAFVFLVLSTILFNIRLFFLRFVDSQILTRDTYSTEILGNGVFGKIFQLIKTTVKYFFFGYYHANGLQEKLIIFVVFLVAFMLVLNFLYKKLNNIKYNLNNDIITFFIVLIFIGLFSFVASLNDNHYLINIFKIVCPPLVGFSFARIYIVNIILWYFLFYISLNIIIKLFNDIKIANIFTCGIVVLNLFFIFTARTQYNDLYKSILKNVFHYGNYISYNEFYDKNLFECIKKDLNYKGEITVGLGYHPGILMYNNFNTADGYIAVYPLVDALQFQKLVQPEFNINKTASDYYTNWYGRRYLYNSEISYEPTRIKTTTPVTLNIDIDVYKNHYKGKYIISRAPIKNTEDLGIKLLNSYIDDKYFYNMWVYEVIYE